MSKTSDIYIYLKDKIISKEYGENFKLLSENQLCSKFKVSRTVVRSTMKKLINEGLIYSRKSIGYFTNESKYWKKVIPWTKSNNNNNSAKVIKFEYKMPEYFIEKYKIDENDFCSFLKLKINNNTVERYQIIFFRTSEVLNIKEVELEKSIVEFLKKSFDFLNLSTFMTVDKTNETDTKNFEEYNYDLVINKYSCIKDENEIIIQLSIERIRVDKFELFSKSYL